MGVKITGAGFPIYVGKMARFQRALEAFFLDEARKAAISRCSRRMLSTRHPVTARVSCLIRRGRCITAISTTFISFLLPKCL